MKNALNNLLNKFNTLKGAVERRDLFVGQQQYGIVRYNVSGVNTGISITSEVISQKENAYIRNGNDDVVTISMNRSLASNEVLSKFVMVRFDSADAVVAFESKCIKVNANMELIEVREDGTMFNLISKEEVVCDVDALSDVSFFLYSASSVKDKAAVFYVGDRSEANKALNYKGVWAGVCMTINDAALAGKHLSRMGLNWSGTSEVPFYSTVVLYDGFLEGFKDGVKDGEVIVREDFICDLFNLERGQVTFDVQARIADGTVAKFKTQATTNKGFDFTLEHLLKRHGFTMEQLKANKVLPAVGKPVFRLVGQGEAVAIIDQNASKCESEIEFDKGVKFLLMAIAKETKSKFNMQLLQKVILAVAEEGQVALDKWVSDFKKYFESIVENRFDTFLDQFFNEDELEFIKEDFGLSLIRSVAPSNPATASKIAEDAASGILQMVEKLSIPDGLGLNGAVSSDFAAIFGDYHFIKDNEILIGGEKGKLKGEGSLVGKRCILQKVPNMFVKEYASLTVVSPETLTHRVKAANISDDLKEVLISWYNRVPSGSFVLPNTKEMFILIAGMDTDFDKCFLFFNDLIVKPLFAKEERLYISTKVANAIAEGNRFEAKRLKKAFGKINYDTIFIETFKRVIEHEGLVGKITNENDAIIAMMTMCVLGDYSIARLFISKNITNNESTHNKAAFVVPTVANAAELGLSIEKGQVLVNEAFAKYIVKEMRACEVTEQNIMAFLREANKVFRLFQEGNIDGAKTSEYVALVITAKGFVPLSLTKNRLEVNLHGDDRSIKIVAEERNAERNEIVFEDVMGRLRADMIQFVNNEVFPVMVKQVNDTKYDKDIMTRMSQEFGKVDGAIIDEMFTLTSAYNAIYQVERVAKGSQINRDSEGNVGYLHKAVKGIFNRIQFLAEYMVNGDKEKAALLVMAATILRANHNPYTKQAYYSLQSTSTRKMIYTQNPAMAALAYLPSYEVKGNVVAGPNNGTFTFVDGVSICNTVVLDNKFIGANKDKDGNKVPVVGVVVDGVCTVTVSPANHKNYKEVDDTLSFVGVDGLVPFAKGRNSGCVMINGKVYIHEDVTQTFHDAIGLADQELDVKEVPFGLSRTETMRFTDMQEGVLYYINDMVTTRHYAGKNGYVNFVVLDLEEEGTTV